MAVLFFEQFFILLNVFSSVVVVIATRVMAVGTAGQRGRAACRLNRGLFPVGGTT